VTDVHERRLRARLARVEALHRGATTTGEREAAAKARQRLLARLEEVRANDPVARFCAEHLSELAEAPLPPPPPELVPEESELLLALARWETGDWTPERLHAWACEVVDQVTFPDDPREAGACVGEVLLQLAALHHVPLRPSDVPRIRRFVRQRDWDDWFALLTEAATRAGERRARVRRVG
jgi:hypothetical protein